jgi:hypothetical protein
MTQTTTADGAETRRRFDTLINLLVTLLTPMFFAPTGGDVRLARIAALETIISYQAQTGAGLIAVAKIISFGIATLDSLSLSMNQDLEIPMILRLRGNANALDRSGERNERAFRAAQAEPAARAESEPDYDEAEVRASVAEAQRRAAEFRAAYRAPATQTEAAAQAEPAPPAEPAPAAQAELAAPAVPARDRQSHRSAWAAAMAEVAAEEIAAAANLPPRQREEAKERAAILSSTANALLSGATADRPKPDDQGGMTRRTPP